MKQEYECPLCRLGKYRAPSSSELKRHIWFEHGEGAFVGQYGHEELDQAMADLHPKDFERAMRASTIKPAEPGDDPDVVMAAGMPRIENSIMTFGAATFDGAGIVQCPMCGMPCNARPHLLREARKIYPGRLIALCTECAIRGNAEKGRTPAWIQERSVSPDQILQMVIDLSEGPPVTLWEVKHRKNNGIYWHEPTRTFHWFDEGVEQVSCTEVSAEFWPDKRWQRKFEHAKKWAVLQG